MDENEKKYIDELKEYWQGFPEAPVSDTFRWMDAAGYEHMLTLRAYSAHTLFAQIEKVESGIADLGGKPLNGAIKPAPKQEPKQAPKAEVDQPAVAPVPVEEGRIYNVAALFHDQTKAGKDILKVITVESEHSGKYGVTAWHGGPSGFKTWPVGPDNKYQPEPAYSRVVIKEPVGDSKYPEVVKFLPMLTGDNSNDDPFGF